MLARNLGVVQLQFSPSAFLHIQVLYYLPLHYKGSWIIEALKMTDSSVLPPQQFSQSSRKGKRAWRKHVDITEIQQGLEGVREEVIHG